MNTKKTKIAAETSNHDTQFNSSNNSGEDGEPKFHLIYMA